MSNNEPKFPLGRTVITRGADDALTEVEVQDALKRHQCGDWGELCVDAKQQNEDSVKRGSRLLSAYRTDVGQKFWIITEADRSVTTVLLPEEY